MIKDSSVLTIDVGGTCLKMAEFQIDNSGDSITLMSYAVKEYSSELAEENFPEAFAEAFKALMEENNFISRQVRLSISSLHAFQRLSKLPPLMGNRSRATAVVESEAKLTVPYPLEEVLWDYQLIKHTRTYEIEAESTGEDDAPAEKITETVEELEALFVALKDDLASAICATLLDADFEVLSVEVSPTAVYNAARANMFGEESCDMILDLGGRGSNLIIIDGARVFIRAIPIGGNTITQQIAKEFTISFDDAEEMKRKHGFVALGGAYEDSDSEVAATISKIARNVMTRLHGEINRSINAWRSMYGGNRPQRLFIAGGSSIIPYVPHFLNEKLHLEVNFLNTFPVINISELIDKEHLLEYAHVLTPLIGLGIKHIRTCPIEISLIPKVIQKSRDLVRRKPYFYISAAITVLLLLVFYGGVSANAYYHWRLTKSKDQTITNAEEIRGHINKAISKRDEHKAVYEALRDIAVKRSRWVDVLNELQKCTPENMWFTQIDGVTKVDFTEQSAAPVRHPVDDGMGDGPPPDEMGEGTMENVPSAPAQEVAWLRLKGHSLVMNEDDPKTLEDHFQENLVNSSKSPNSVFKVFKNDDDKIEGYKNPALTLGSGKDNVTSFVIYVQLKNAISQ